MAKRAIIQLKEYFKAAKRPTENQFGDLIDSYAHLDDPNIFSPNYKEKSFHIDFPHQQTDMAVDILLGNDYVGGHIEVEIVGSYNFSNSVGVIRKQFDIGANPDNAIWYQPLSRIVEAAGPIVDNIYIGGIIWDTTLNQYKLTIYHTHWSGNPYEVRIKQHTYGGALAINNATLSGVYSNPLVGQKKHYVYYNENVGIGTTLPQAKLQINSTYSTPDQLGDFIIGNIDFPNIRFGTHSQYTWIQSHAGSPLHINSLGNNIILNKNAGNVGIGVDNPQSKLEVNGFITSKILNDTITPSNIAGFNINQLGSNVLEMSFARDGQGLGVIKTLSDNPLTIGTNNIERIRVQAITGNVGIGTKNPDQKLTVKGKIHAEDIIIDTNVPADYVFQKYYDNYSSIRPDYQMPDLAELESYIKENKHLPEIPSGETMMNDGVKIGDFQMKLLQKIEELTLYIISLKKEIDTVKHN